MRVTRNHASPGDSVSLHVLVPLSTVLVQSTRSRAILKKAHERVNVLEHMLPVKIRPDHHRYVTSYLQVSGCNISRSRRRPHTKQVKCDLDSGTIGGGGMSNFDLKMTLGLLEW